MPIDPSFRPFAADRRYQTRRPPPGLAIERIRAVADAAMLDATPLPVAAVEDHAIDGDGHSLSLRLYRPALVGPLPFVLFVHGGGFVWGSIATHDGLCRRLCRESGAVVASVGYRLAPETHFPGPAQDVTAALTYLCNHAAEFGLDAHRFALCGDSAGGNLALAATAMARAEGRRQRSLCLLYPAVDPTCSSPSQAEFAEGPILTRDAMRWFWECYLGPHPAVSEALYAPLGSDLAGFPATTIVTAEYDPLRDEGEALARHLTACAVQVTLRRFEGAVHGFLSFPVRSPVSDACIGHVAGALRAALDQP